MINLIETRAAQYSAHPTGGSRLVFKQSSWLGTLRPDDRRGKKYVVSSTLERVDWNAEFVSGDLGKAIQQLKRESGKGLCMVGVKLPLALT